MERRASLPVSSTEPLEVLPQKKFLSIFYVPRYITWT